MSTAGELIAAAAARLAAAGVATPRVDAELLLAHVAGIERSRLVLLGRLSPAQSVAFDSAVERRAARIPLQHITGCAPFRRVELAVGPGVFVPRPETELLVDAVLPALRLAAQPLAAQPLAAQPLAAQPLAALRLAAQPLAAQPLAVDLCSGSGALAVALVDELPGIRVVAVERPGSAIEWLRRNTSAISVEVVVADVTAELLTELRGIVDAVVCNPPYLPAGTAVEAEVRADPDVALFAGADGLALMPAVIARAAELLRPGGVVAIEHDDSHAGAVPGLLAADGRWRAVADHDDLTGRPRYVTAIRADCVPGRTSQQVRAG